MIRKLLIFILPMAFLLAAIVTLPTMAETPGISKDRQYMEQMNEALKFGLSTEPLDNNPTWFFNYTPDDSKDILKGRFAFSLGSGLYLYPAVGIDFDPTNNIDYFSGAFSIAYMPTIFENFYLGVEFGAGYITETDIENIPGDPASFIGGVAFIRGGYILEFLKISGYNMGLFAEAGNIGQVMDDWSFKNLEFGFGFTWNEK
ncbi:MAG: hypothetical protein PVJ60_00835 [Phycisphaerales bacterium]|jgi:hypothetical protein